MSRATRPANAPSRATNITLAPAWARARAAPSPRPRLAPVTRATFPFNSLDMTSPPLGWRHGCALEPPRQPRHGQIMLTDRYGLPLTTSSEAARDAYVAGADCLLSAAHGDAAHLERAIEADPDF